MDPEMMPLSLEMKSLHFGETVPAETLFRDLRATWTLGNSPLGLTCTVELEDFQQERYGRDLLVALEIIHRTDVLLCCWMSCLVKR